MKAALRVSWSAAVLRNTLRRAKKEARPRIFRDALRRFARVHYRDFPWRETRDPFRILVSEIMLQQTQTARVLPKYRQFIKVFPSFRALAEAAPKDVLALWQGLGYNRRALYLQRLARIVMVDFAGKLPLELDVLRTLPGIGNYTAAAVRVFSLNTPVALIETNIRSVFTYLFFHGTRKIRDEELLPLIEACLDHKAPRVWYYVLMDYGVYLKGETKGLVTRSAHHRPQSKFKGSDRQIRGRIIAVLLRNERVSYMKLVSELETDGPRVQKILIGLEKDGLVIKRGRSYLLPGT